MNRTKVKDATIKTYHYERLGKLLKAYVTAAVMRLQLRQTSSRLWKWRTPQQVIVAKPSDTTLGQSFRSSTRATSFRDHTPRPPALRRYRAACRPGRLLLALDPEAGARGETITIAVHLRQVRLVTFHVHELVKQFGSTDEPARAA